MWPAVEVNMRAVLWPGSPHLLTPLTSIHFMSIHSLTPSSKGSRGGQGGMGWGWEEDSREIWSNRPAQHCPLKSQQTWLRHFHLRDSLLETFYLHSPALSSFLDHNQISLQYILSWITSAGRVNTSEHAHEQRYYRRQSLLMPA